MAQVDERICVCGHHEDTHQHFRPGTDCGVCGSQRCPAYRSSTPTLLARTRAWLRATVSRRTRP